MIDLCLIVALAILVGISIYIQNKLDDTKIKLDALYEAYRKRIDEISHLKNNNAELLELAYPIKSGVITMKKKRLKKKNSARRVKP